MLLGTLDASLLENIWTGRGVKKKTSKGRGAYRAGKGRGINKAGEGIVRVGYGSRSSKMNF